MIASFILTAVLNRNSKREVGLTLAEELTKIMILTYLEVLRRSTDKDMSGRGEPQILPSFIL